MSGEDIRRYTFAEIKRMVEAGETRSDWDRVRNMAEEELERSIADDPDWRDLIVDWDKATWFPPEKKEAVTLSIDQEVVDWFRQQGGDFRDRITKMLSEYVRARRRDAA
jgi:uncharacterized protein (DUF4415 family)